VLAKVVSTVVVAVVGTGVFEALGLAVSGLVGSFFETLLCAVGAFLSALLFSRPRVLTVRGNLLPAVLITISTFGFIAVGHALEQVFERHMPVDFEPFGLVFWAVVATSWLVVPGAAVVLSVCSHLCARLGLGSPRARAAV